MYTIIWEYRVAPAMRMAFEQHYHANGIWAQCFRRHAGFVETQLLHDQADAYRYLTIDYWQHAAAFQEFYEQHHGEYERIDQLCRGLTISERRVGTFAILASAGSQDR